MRKKDLVLKFAAFSLFFFSGQKPATSRVAFFLSWELCPDFVLRRLVWKVTFPSECPLCHSADFKHTHAHTLALIALLRSILHCIVSKVTQFNVAQFWHGRWRSWFINLDGCTNNEIWFSRGMKSKRAGLLAGWTEAPVAKAKPGQGFYFRDPDLTPLMHRPFSLINCKCCTLCAHC